MKKLFIIGAIALAFGAQSVEAGAKGPEWYAPVVEFFKPFPCNLTEQSAKDYLMKRFNCKKVDELNNVNTHILNGYSLALHYPRIANTLFYGGLATLTTAVIGTIAGITYACTKKSSDSSEEIQDDAAGEEDVNSELQNAVPFNEVASN